MKKLFVVTAVIFAAVLFLVSGAVHSQSGGKHFVEGELLVNFAGGPPSRASALAHERAGATVVKTFDLIGWQLVKLPDGMSTDEGLAHYRQSAGCLLAQPNYIYRILDTIPNDPQFASLYGMTKISAPAAWDTTTGNPAVIVADIDTGVDYTHPDLAANMWQNSGETPNNGMDDDGNGFVDDYYGYDFINQDSNPVDDQSHGTHTVGTIGAIGNNGAGVVGVNWNVKMMALKTHASDGNSTAATVIAAFNYVTMMKNRGVNIRVTSNSWAGAPEAPGYDQALKDAIDAAGAAGVLHVFAAGNEARNIDAAPAYPASYNSPSVLAVASSTSTDTRSSFSNWGATSVDVAAPGSGILSTIPGGGYGSKSGTSMATPHVAGAAALLVGLNPNLSVASLKATLMNTVDVLPAFNGLVVSGGRINVARALTQQTVCNFSLSQTSQSFPASGGASSVNLTTQAACSWGAFSNASWVTVNSASGGSGNTTVNFTVAPNPGGMRTGVIFIGSQAFTVHQAAAGNGSGTVGLYAPSGAGFFLRNSNMGGIADITFTYGPAGLGWMPLVGDWDGDGVDTIGLYAPSGAAFFLRNSNTGGVADITFTYGGAGGGLVPLVGDWDGDGVDSVGLYAPSGAGFFLRNTNSGGVANITFTYGPAGAGLIPLVGDWDGDGVDTVGLYAPSGAAFFLRNTNSGGIADISFTYGPAGLGWMPLVGDWDGDGVDTIGLYAPSGAAFFLRNSNTGGVADITFTYGGAGGGLVPLVGDWDGL